MIVSKSPVQICRPRLKAGVAAIALVVLTGCSGQTDLYDYLSSDKPSASANAPSTALQQPPGGPAAQPANAAAGSYAGLDNTEAALAAARPSNGIEKSASRTRKVWP
jgi:hypothetical protein